MNWTELCEAQRTAIAELGKFGRVCNANWINTRHSLESGPHEYEADQFTVEVTFLNPTQAVEVTPGVLDGFNIIVKAIIVTLGSDLDLWINHFDRFDIAFKLSATSEGICLETDEGEGYIGFNFSTSYDLSGKFLSYGVWE